METYQGWRQRYFLSLVALVLPLGLLSCQNAATPPAAATATVPSVAAAATPPPTPATTAPPASTATVAATALPPTAIPAPPTAVPGPRRQALFLSLPCQGCHRPDASGDIGPRIANTSLSFEQVLNQVRNPREMMIPFSPAAVSDDQVRDIYAFLKSLP